MKFTANCYRFGVWIDTIGYPAGWHFMNTTETSYTWTGGIDRGTTYNVRVAAANVDDCPPDETVTAEWSADSWAEVTTPRPDPPAPSGFSGSATGTRSISASWTHVSDSTKYEFGIEVASLGGWQTKDLSRGTTSTTWSRGLAPGTTYKIRVRAHGDGGVWAAKWGDYSEETVTTDLTVTPTETPTATATPSLSLPPAPSNVRASVDLAQARVTVSWNEITGLDPDNPYKLELGQSDLGIQPTTVEWPDPSNAEHAGRIITDMFVTSGGRVSRTIELPGLSLPCGPDKVYSFRVSAYGNGDDYLEEYGPTREATFGALTTARGKSADGATVRVPSTVNHLCTPPLRAPEVDVIPLPQRRAQVRWASVTDATSYQVDIWDTQFVRSTEAWASYKTNKSNETSITIELDSIHKNRGLSHQPAGFKFRVRAIADSGSSIPDSEYAEFTIVDSPIRSVNGDSRQGKLKIKWNSGGNGARYTVRWRRISDKMKNPHSSEGWHPEEWNPDADSKYDWDSATTSSLGYDIDNNAKGIEDEEIYAVQLNYTVGSNQYFSARERYAWVSDRRGGYSIIRRRGGERVGNFPLFAPLDDPLAPNKKTYAYRVCADTFATEKTKQDEWVALIEHALEQWESATDGLVMMDPVLDESGNRAPCTNYQALHQAIVDKLNSLLAGQSDSDTPDSISALYIDNYIRTLTFLGDFHRQDRENNEILMVDIELHRLTMFKGDELDEFSDSLGFDGCIFEEDAYACAIGRRRGLFGQHTTTDILLRSDRYENTNLTIPSVSFNTCVTSNSRLYADLIHEAGHALGVGGSSEERAYVKNHPPLADSVMNYNEESIEIIDVDDKNDLLGEPDCSPHPMDILAIYAIYQTVD